MPTELLPTTPALAVGEGPSLRFLQAQLQWLRRALLEMVLQALAQQHLQLPAPMQLQLH